MVAGDSGLEKINRRLPTMLDPVSQERHGMRGWPLRNPSDRKLSCAKTRVFCVF